MCVPLTPLGRVAVVPPLPPQTRSRVARDGLGWVPCSTGCCLLAEDADAFALRELAAELAPAHRLDGLVVAERDDVLVAVHVDASSVTTTVLHRQPRPCEEADLPSYEAISTYRRAV